MTNGQSITSASRYTWSLPPVTSEQLSQWDNLDSIWRKRLKKLYPSFSSEHFVLPNLSHLPSPFQMKGLAKATQRVLDAIANGERIVVFGDYDVDGTTSCAMLSRFFKCLGHPIEIYIPDRLKEGYGLNPIGVNAVFGGGQQTCQKKGHNGLIITVDNGISAHAGVEEAQKLGIDVIITDHHEPPEELPPAFAILNPKQKGCDFPEKHIAGVGVAFFFMVSLRASLRSSQLKCSFVSQTLNLTQFLDLVAIGTIADMVPLVGCNHLLGRMGLQVLAQHVRTGERPGIAALLELAGAPTATPSWVPTGYDIGFKLGPRLNAAGRLGSAMAALQVLETDDPTLALELAKKLHDENGKRQELQKSFVEEAIKSVDQMNPIPPVLVLHQPHWHPGVVGLVASRLVEKYNRPAIVFGAVGGQWKGSGRSTTHFDLFRAIDPIRHHLKGFGGHFHAIGLSVDEDGIAVVKDHLEKYARLGHLNPIQRPSLFIDGVVSLSSLKIVNLNRFFLMEPFGQGNQRPRWLIKNVSVKQMKPVGQFKDKGHIRVLISDGTEDIWAIGFQMALDIQRCLQKKPLLDVVLEFKQGVWQGKNTVDCQIVDFNSED